MTLYAKAKAYEAGERVTFSGKEFAPLYTPRNNTLINLFQITTDEQRQLRTIIETDIAVERRRERDKKRVTAFRRAAGVVPTLDAAEAKYLQTQALRIQGLSVKLLRSGWACL